MKSLIAVVLLLGSSAPVLAGVYDLKFSRVAHVDEPEVCQRVAEDVANELTAQAGVAIVDFGCVEDSYTNLGLDAVISYQAPARLAVTSTFAPSVYSAAFYPSRAECNAHLDLQRRLFTEATGLEPLSAVCRLDTSFSQKWETRVDGLGTATIKPERTAASFWGTLVDGDAVLAAYQAAAEAYGISIFEAGVTHLDVNKHVVLRYYASTPYFLKDYDALVYGSLDACSEALPEVDRILQGAERPVVTFCEGNPPNGSATLHATSFEPVLQPQSVFVGRALPSRYTSVTACEQAAAGIAVVGDILGAACSGYGGDFRVHLFTLP